MNSRYGNTTMDTSKVLHRLGESCIQKVDLIIKQKDTFNMTLSW